MLLPGETARAHRHTPTAIRFIIEGQGAYTSVDGERVIMNPGDLVLTPSWTWHDHGNLTDKRVVWMDGLDLPLVQSLDAMFFQLYDVPMVPLNKPNNDSQRHVRARHAHADLGEGEGSLFAAADLLLGASRIGTQRPARQAGSPYDGIALEYRCAPVERVSSC